MTGVGDVTPVIVARHGETSVAPATAPIVTPAVVALPSNAETGVPDLTGLSAREALRELARLGLSARMQGAGVVVQQHPPAGSPLEPGATCTLVLNRRPPSRPIGAMGDQGVPIARTLRDGVKR